MDEWLKQGYPPGVSATDLLGYDFFCDLPLACGHWPAFERVVVEETDGLITYFDEDGALRIDAVRDQGSGFVTRKWLKFPVENRADFEKMKERYHPEDTERRREGFAAMSNETHTSEHPWKCGIYGFYWMMRQWLGFENLSLAFYDCPEFIDEMLDFILDFNVRLVRTHVAGAKLDICGISEDMAYKTACMVSPAIVRQKFVPRYRELVQEIRRAGAEKIVIDSDGHIEELIPLWIESGIDGASPVEIAAEQDILEYAKAYPQFLFLGGIDKRVLARGRKEVKDEVVLKARELYRRGGWIPAVDHAVPADAKFENFKYMLELLKECW